MSQQRNQEMEEKINTLSKKFKDLKTKAIEKGLREKEVIRQLLNEFDRPKAKRKRTWDWKLIFLLVLLPIMLAIVGYQYLDPSEIFDESTPCAVENSIFVMEAFRPVADCKICEGLTEVPKVSKLTAKQFVQEYAYSGRPLVVKDATTNWTAVDQFSFEYFKHLYSEKALNITEEECQFFPYETEFHSLREVFSMSKERSQFKAEPWYIGWSNCDGDVRAELRKHYSKPYFIPSDSEHSETDWIFMGGVGRGANIHLDNVDRPSWQAQLSGRKTWTLIPPPECEHVCQRFNVTIEKGEIVVVDTNQWYHATVVEPGEISITIGSEYD